MSERIHLIGSFRDEHQLEHCIETLHHENVKELRVYAPIPIDKVVAKLYSRPSWVRLCVLIAGISGVITAFVMTIGTSLEWNLITGGKPVASIPPYLVIVFELMVLFSAVTAFWSFVLISGMPEFESPSGYKSRFAADEFGLVIRCDENDASKLENLLRDAGAQEIEREAA